MQKRSVISLSWCTIMIMTVSLSHYSSYLVTDSSPITPVPKKIQWHHFFPCLFRDCCPYQLAGLPPPLDNSVDFTCQSPLKSQWFVTTKVYFSIILSIHPKTGRDFVSGFTLVEQWSLWLPVSW